MAANKFVLKHQQIEVDLTLGATPGINTTDLRCSG
jgi:hypothetical protein